MLRTDRAMHRSRSMMSLGVARSVLPLEVDDSQATSRTQGRSSRHERFDRANALYSE
jgi:hypothetical protein